MLRFEMLSRSFVSATPRSSACRALASGRELDAPVAEHGPTVECSALTRRAVGLFDQAGLFMVRLGQPKAVPVVEERLASLAHDRPGPPRVKPIPRQKSGLHRYCSGCAQ